MTTEEFNVNLREMNRNKEKLEKMYLFCVGYFKLHLSCKFGKQDAEDIAHEIFENKIMGHPPKKYVHRPLLWLSKIVDNYVYTLKKNEKRTLELVENFSYKPDLTENIPDEELKAALNKLDEVSLQILVYYYYYNYQLSEIAPMVNLSYANVRAKASRAIKTLRKYVTKRDSE